MTRILHVVNRMAYGGIETFIMNVYRNINSKNVIFDFAVHNNNPGDFDQEIEKKGGNIYTFPSRGKNPIAYFYKWYKFFKFNKNKYDAIHMHVSSLTTIFPIIMAKYFNIRVRIVHAHSTSQPGLIHLIMSFINKKIIRKYSTKLLACSTEAGEFVFGKNNYELLSNGIELKRYFFNPEIKKEVRKMNNISINETAYVHVGRFTYAKNHQFLLKVFKEILKTNPYSKLFLIGEGELKEEIELRVKSENISGNVFFLGSRDDVNKLLMGMDCFIFPSIYEGLPISLIEAQASGLDVYASDNISHEVKLTPLVKFISLECSPQKWADFIVNRKKAQNRNLYNEKISKTNYNISSTTTRLLKIYSERNN